MDVVVEGLSLSEGQVKGVRIKHAICVKDHRLVSDALSLTQSLFVICPCNIFNIK